MRTLIPGRIADSLQGQKHRAPMIREPVMGVKVRQRALSEAHLSAAERQVL